MDSKKNLFRSSFLIVLAVSAASVSFAGTARPRVEGIVYDAQNPDKSAAIIDGDVYKAGDRVGNYEVRKIGPESVELVNRADGGSLVLRAEELPGRNPGPAPGEAPVISSEEAAGGNGFMRLVQKVVNSNTSLAESSALTEMRKIRAAAAEYIINEGYMLKSIDLPKLVRAGRLPRDYEDSVKGAYRFSLALTDRGVDIQADPVDLKSDLRHFLMTSEGTLYYERGRPATRQSAFQNS